jgi:hypothetical protein
MLVASVLVNFRPELEGIHFGHLLESIARWSDWIIQIVIDKGPSTGLDDYEFSVELASVTNLVDIAIYRILVREINGSHKLMEIQRSRLRDA